MKQFYLKFYALLLCLVIGGGNLWAEDAPVNAVLWADNFGNTEGDGQTTFTKIETFVGDYKYGGRTGYSSNATSVTYTGNNNVRLSKASGTNVTDTHLWFVKEGQGEFTTSAINLYGAKKVNFSFSRSKGLTIVKYSYNGTIWNTLWEETSTSAQTNKNADIVTENHDVIYLKIIEGNNSNNLRVDNLSLKVVTASSNNTQPTEKKDLSPFSKDSYTLAAGAEGNISDLVSIPSDYDGVITYTSNNDDVIIIESDGSYLVGDAGTTTISATASATSNYNAVNQEVTITITPNYTITWNVNGETTTTQVQEGAQINFAEPNNTTIEGKQFVGWVSEEINGITDDAPTFITSATATNDVIYYAVFANVQKGNVMTAKLSCSLTTANSSYTKTEVKDDKGNTWKLYTNVNKQSIDNVDHFYYGLNSSSNGYNIESPTYPEKIIAIKALVWNTNSTKDRKALLCSKDDVKQPEDGNLGTMNINRNTKCVEQSFTLAKKDFNHFYIYATTAGAIGFEWIEVTYGEPDSFSNYCTTVPEQQTLSLVAELGSNYYATFSSENAVEFENDVVYTVSASGEKLSINSVESKRVPANTGVLIKSVNAEEKYSVINSAKALEGNMLLPASKDMSEVPGCQFYKLAYGIYTETEKTDLGFYYGKEGGAAFTCKAGTAYLAVPTGPNVKSFVFADDATAVKSVAVPTVDANAPVYNMAGQRVSANTKGIVFQNGKKYFNK